MRSAEQNVCPYCGCRLKVIGNRRRKFINSAGDGVVLIIRRLRCRECGRIHHKLPDTLVPYKRYDSESIEAVVSGGVILLWQRMSSRSIAGGTAGGCGG